jgi:DNA-binding CsgD family transcriptional regulator
MPTTSAALGPKARKVLFYIARGHSSEEIASALDIKPATLKVHIKRLFRQLEVSDRIEAVVVGRALGLVPSTPVYMSLLRNVSLDSEEQRLLALAARRLTYEAIAQKMGRTTRRVRYLMARLFAKLAVTRRELAVLKAMSLGLIQVPDLAN